MSNDDLHFSSPLQAFKKLAKWVDGLTGTFGNIEAMSLAFSSGMIDNGALCEPPLKINSFE
jgi:hypothetical protein